ncbi:MAG TPA: glycosyltransferase, partial [Phnomibacter sp.]|nr:glycosyltransferase [Phnomibacter sp.]
MSKPPVSQLSISLIVPVFNRPAEVEELLQSLTTQTNSRFEVVLVEDGSQVPCLPVVEKYQQQLQIQYHTKPNSGPGLTRNMGATQAKGNYFVFLDSDCVLPPHYIQTVYTCLQRQYVDAFGGPDKAHEQFTPIQKAINYGMTSFLTTGGIRGGGEKLDKFHPRSFNMGYSRQVFNATGGFAAIRFGEDIDMSIRILKAGFSTALIKDAYVYHKRRSTFRQFFKQVFNSGIARINLNKRHPGTLKLVHTFPSLFVLGMLSMLILGISLSPWFLLPMGIFA